MQTIDKVLSNRNLTEACKEVVKNKGTWGVDKMGVEQLKPYLDKNKEELSEEIRQGIYIPHPISYSLYTSFNPKFCSATTYPSYLS